MENSDVFFEQIVPIKKSAGTWAAIIGLWFVAILLIAFLFLTNLLGSFTLILCFGVGYGAFWLSNKFNVEFEYIITNGTLDIDKITNKSSRKRILSFELSQVTRLEKYNPAAITNINKKELVIACNPQKSDTYFITANRTGKNNVNLVFAPNKKLQSAIEKFAPRFLTNSVFKD